MEAATAASVVVVLVVTLVAKNGHFRKFKLQSVLNHATCSN